MTRELWLHRVPDEPRFLEARSLLLRGAPLVPSGAGGALAVAPEDSLAVLLGTCTAPDLRHAVVESGMSHLLVQEETCDLARVALPGWQCERAFLHVLSPDAPALWPADDGGHLRVLPPGTVSHADAPGPAGPDDGAPGDDWLHHVPAVLRVELSRANQAAPLFCALYDGLLVAFAYAAHTTETLVDVSIDTLGPWRRKGLGALASRALVRHVVARGRTPVWGAIERNVASRRLAARLGFEMCAVVWLCDSPP